MKIAHDLPNNRYKTKQELEAAIKEIGDLTREKEQLEIDANAKIQAIQDKLSKAVAPLDAKIGHIGDGIQFYCDENRKEMFGKAQSVELITGTCKYVAGKKSIVGGKGLEKTIQKAIQDAKLTKSVNSLQARLLKIFLRMKIEPNKDLMLKYPKLSQKLGYKIKTGDELMHIKPSQVDTEIEVAA